MGMGRHRFFEGTLLLLAALLAGCGKTDAAKAERVERDSALYRQAFAAEQSGDLKEAERLFGKVLIEEPQSFSAHFQLATLLQDHAKDYVGAIYHYRQYLALRPESEKSDVVTNRIWAAEQMLAPQILEKVGSSVPGITQANLLKENERLNRSVVALESEKSALLEEKAKAEKELENLRGDNERLRSNLRKMRVDETVQSDDASSARRIGTAAREEAAAGAGITAMDAKDLKAMREEAAALAREGSNPPPPRKPLVDVPSTESVIKKVEEKFTGEAPKPEAAAVAAWSDEQKKADARPKPEAQGKAEKSSLSELSLFGRGEKKESKTASDANQRTYVVQPGDTLFRVAEKFYGDPTKWKRIRDANRTRIDPDGRIRAGQIIMVP